LSNDDPFLYFADTARPFVYFDYDSDGLFLSLLEKSEVYQVKTGIIRHKKSGNKKTPGPPKGAFCFFYFRVWQTTVKSFFTFLSIIGIHWFHLNIQRK